jgi:S1-C subfamily serine protease
VVNIDITGKPEQTQESSGPFGMFQTPEEVVPEGTASGVIISQDGYILTNNHVAANTTSIRVTLHDGREFKAKVVGLDPHSDLAVVKIDAANLPAASIGNSSAVKVGQQVIAVGNPLGIGTTATHGIISAIRSPFEIKGNIFPEILQTDAPINPGNSGGALADLEGNIIGINSAIASTSGGSIGIGFAIPIDMAIQHANQLIAHGKVVYPWLGIKYLASAPEQSASGQSLPAHGALISAVVPGSPAAAAGIQAKDVITQIDGQSVGEPEKVNYLVMQHKPGDKIQVTISRNGSTMTKTVTLGTLPANLAAPQSDQEPEEVPGPGMQPGPGMVPGPGMQP